MKHIGTVFALPPSQNCTGDWHVFLRFGTWKQQDMICWFILLGRTSISCLYTKIAGKISVTSSTVSVYPDRNRRQILRQRLLAPGNFWYIYLSNNDEICDINDELRERGRFVRISSLLWSLFVALSVYAVAIFAILVVVFQEIASPSFWGDHFI